jgi:glutamine amidotransferase
MGKRIVILDYGMGNLYSISQALIHFGFSPILSNNAQEIENADYLILPGVGAFEGAMKQLDKLNLISLINEHVKDGKPLMGICLGMQLLFDNSYEFGEFNGLGLTKGDVIRFPMEDAVGNKLRIPHIGWNTLNEGSKKWSSTPLKDFPNNGMMYFVHSYYSRPSNEDDVLATSNYCGVEFCSAVQRDNIFGFQAHPEKSGELGLSVYKNFIEYI